MPATRTNRVCWCCPVRHHRLCRTGMVGRRSRSLRGPLEQAGSSLGSQPRGCGFESRTVYAILVRICRASRGERGLVAVAQRSVRRLAMAETGVRLPVAARINRLPRSRQDRSSWPNGRGTALRAPTVRVRIPPRIRTPLKPDRAGKRRQRSTTGGAPLSFRGQSSPPCPGSPTGRRHRVQGAGSAGSNPVPGTQQTILGR
jgi:hypothetical protein